MLLSIIVTVYFKVVMRIFLIVGNQGTVSSERKVRFKEGI